MGERMRTAYTDDLTFNEVKTIFLKVNDRIKIVLRKWVKIKCTGI